MVYAGRSFLAGITYFEGLCIQAVQRTLCSLEALFSSNVKYLHGIKVLLHSLRCLEQNPTCGCSLAPQMKRIELYADALPAIPGSIADTPLCTFLVSTWPKGDAGKTQQCKQRGCGDGPQCHLRFFLRGGRMVSLAVTRLRSDRRLPGGDRGVWWTWTRPQHVCLLPVLRSIPVTKILSVSFLFFPLQT